MVPYLKVLPSLSLIHSFVCHETGVTEKPCTVSGQTDSLGLEEEFPLTNCLPVIGAEPLRTRP